MSEEIAKHLLENIEHNDMFLITITHSECGNVLGLTKGLMTKSPRLHCFECDEIVDSIDCKIDITEAQL